MRNLAITLALKIIVLGLFFGVAEGHPATLANEPAKPVQTGNFCDQTFVGEPISMSLGNVKLEVLLGEIHRRFGVNFRYGPDVANVIVNLRIEDIPWTLVLRTELAENAIEATCADNKLVSLATSLFLKNQRKADKTPYEFIKFRYLQPTATASVDVAGRGGSGGAGSQQGCPTSGTSGSGSSQGTSTFCSLIDTINEIMGTNKQETSSNESTTGQRASVESDSSTAQGAQVTNGQSQLEYGSMLTRGAMWIPGTNVVLVKGATSEQMSLIRQIVEKVDRPPFQVIVRGLVYTANENKALDVGIQSSIVASTAATRTTGQGTGTGTGTGTGSGSGGSTGTGTSGSPTPVRSAGIGYQSPSPGNLFDVLALIGTVDFNLQANALATKGIISVKSRPFAMVLDGQSSELNIGRQIPVIIQAQNTVGGGAPGELRILDASNVLRIQPFVLDNDKGEPIGVNLGLRFEANDVDLSVTSQGVPSINRQSIQTNLVIGQEKTIILGGFTVDSDSDNRSKVPGIGDIPGLGWLFKRRVKASQMNRLYFAISVTVVPFGAAVQPVDVPVSTEIPGTTVK